MRGLGQIRNPKSEGRKKAEVRRLKRRKRYLQVAQIHPARLASRPQDLECGGKRSATPLWKRGPSQESGVAAPLCHRTPYPCRPCAAFSDFGLLSALGFRVSDFRLTPPASSYSRWQAEGRTRSLQVAPDSPSAACVAATGFGVRREAKRHAALERGPFRKAVSPLRFATTLHILVVRARPFRISAFFRALGFRVSDFRLTPPASSRISRWQAEERKPLPASSADSPKRGLRRGHRIWSAAGSESATPLWQRGPLSESGVAAPLCHRTPYLCRPCAAFSDFGLLSALGFRVSDFRLTPPASSSISRWQAEERKPLPASSADSPSAACVAATGFGVRREAKRHAALANEARSRKAVSPLRSATALHILVVRARPFRISAFFRPSDFGFRISASPHPFQFPSRR